MPYFYALKSISKLRQLRVQSSFAPNNFYEIDPKFLHHEISKISKMLSIIFTWISFWQSKQSWKHWPNVLRIYKNCEALGTSTKLDKYFCFQDTWAQIYVLREEIFLLVKDKSTIKIKMPIIEYTYLIEIWNL